MTSLGTPMSSPPARPRSLLGIALVCALTLGQVLASLHYVVVPHTVCAEHGETIHGEAPGAPDAASVRHGHDDDSWSAGAVSPRDQHDHDHCTHAVEVRSWLKRAPAQAAALAPASVVLCTGDRPATASNPGVPVYLYAPKSSPPV